ncbi:hypothetical protein NQ315_008878 [Exocentrus adspersus]|uniref:Reverse transcriptase domain-containing protein n=1 Tax=Exocentrus adspersus TaxID=1586481 RepID=A0AAV8V5E0_9CUCU|nr:hypothetical protein NQ315_008878 [Exocentrus adspersus]
MVPVQKRSGGRRPVLNLKRLNKYLSPRKFRLISYQKIPQFIQRNDFLAKLDLNQAYFHVPIKQSHRRFLSLVYNQRVYQMTCLPFGLATAPLTFARISNWMASYLRSQGLRIVVYLNDFLLAHQDRSCLRVNVATAISFMQNLGWVINFEKSVLEPVPVCEFLGLRWDTIGDRVSLPHQKIQSLEKDLRQILMTQRWNWKGAKRVLGKMNFAEYAIPLGRLNSRAMQRAARSLPQRNPSRKRTVPAAALEEVRWWLRNLGQASPILPRNPENFLTADASDKGWGAQVGDHFLEGRWSGHQKS